MANGMLPLYGVINQHEIHDPLFPCMAPAAAPSPAPNVLPTAIPEEMTRQMMTVPPFSFPMVSPTFACLPAALSSTVCKAVAVNPFPSLPGLDSTTDSRG
jgi:hypothetical protein